MRILFVDGYNIIGAWPELASLRDVDLALARRQLIDILSEYAATTQHKIVLVFDGYHVKGSRGSEEIISGIQIIYTPEDVTADMVIERLVTKIQKHDDCYVASSDRLVQETILAQGGLRISANELYNLVYNEKNDIRKKIDKPSRPNLLEERLDPQLRAQLNSMIFENNQTIKKRKKT